MKKYFENVRTLDELKAAYRRAAMKHHPDMGGDVAEMQRINAGYEARFEVLNAQQNTAAAEDTTGRTQATTESAGDFMAIVSLLLSLYGLEVELYGRWLWIGGETRRHKEALKAAGCRWCSKKGLWSWHYAEDSVKRRRRGTASMIDIRSKYGSQRFSRGADTRESLPA